MQKKQNGNNIVLVDDSDHDIKYTGNWTSNVTVTMNDNFGPMFRQQSFHSTKSSNASLSYVFHGTSVLIVGGNIETPSFECLIDGKPLDSCQGSGLSNGKHRVIVNIRASKRNIFFFDYIQYSASGDMDRMKDSDSANESSKLTVTQASFSTSISEHAPTAMSTVPDNLATSRGQNLGAIVGGVIGGLGLLLIVVFAILWLRQHRRSRRRAPSSDFVKPSPPPGSIPPAPRERRSSIHKPVPGAIRYMPSLSTTRSLVSVNPPTAISIPGASRFRNLQRAHYGRRKDPRDTLPLYSPPHEIEGSREHMSQDRKDPSLATVRMPKMAEPMDYKSLLD